MSRFRKSAKPEMPALNTASLPDLVFTLLFFFLLASNLQGNVPNVRFQEPEAAETVKLDKKTETVFIYVGEYVDGYTGGGQQEFRIQIDDHWMEIDEIAPYFIRMKSLMRRDEIEQMTVCIRADKNTNMELISGIENALRRARVLKVNYGIAD